MTFPTHRLKHIAALVIALAACRGAAPEPTPAPTPSSIPSPSPATPSAHPAAAGTLHWTDPAAWRRVTPSSSMRRAQWVIPGDGPHADGELTVFWFGSGQGGSVEDNLTRWYGQFEQPDGRPSSAVATREHRTAHGLDVTVTRVEGRFTGGGMPGAPPSGPREGMALLGAIVATPNGPWFFKLTAPHDTAAHASAVFDELVASFDFR